MDVDGWIIQRCSYTDAKGNDRKSYVPPDPFGWDGVIVQDDFPSDDPSDDPLTVPFDKSRVSFDASDDSRLLAGIVSGERLGAFGGREVLAAMEGIGGSEGNDLGEEEFEVW